MNPIQFTRNVRSLNRLRHIAQVLTRHGFGHIVTRMNLGRYVPVWMLRRRSPADSHAADLSVGQRLAKVCTELGPTFIKLGQTLSTRSDLLPPDILAELRMLQDDVPPFDSASAMAVIEQDLGKPSEECFSHIDAAPFASASIGQVYRAKSREGKDLVVKVRRPDIEKTVAADLQLLHFLAGTLESLMPELRIYRPGVLVSEFEDALRRELDYVHEASTTDRFTKAMEGVEGIRIPKVHWDLSGPRVLTLRALPGIALGRILDGDAASENINRKLIARRLADCYLKQAFETGIFHADPHPGNLLIDPPGTVGLIDFGQVGTITPECMTQLIVIAYACVFREVDVVIDALSDMGAVGVETDRRNLHRAFQVLLDKYYGLPIRRFHLGTLLNEFTDVIRRHELVVPREFTMLIKAFSSVASVTAALDPDLNLLELLGPRLRKALSSCFSPKSFSRESALAVWHALNTVRQFPGQLRQALRRFAAGAWRLDVRHENMDRLISELDRSSNRLAFSVVIAAIIVGSSVVVSASTDMRLIGIRVQHFGIMGYLIAGILGLGLSWAIFRSGRLH